MQIQTFSPISIAKKTMSFLLLAGAFYFQATAQNPADSLIFQQKIETCNTEIIGECIVEYGQSFVGTPYVAHTLEGNAKETLVINLRALDCATFVESIFAMAIASQSDDKSFGYFTQIIKALRYHAGAIDGYGSRIHYFSDWLYENQQNGYLRDVSAEIGGVPFTTKVSFMSQNPKYYPALSDKNELEKVKAVEDNMNTRKLSYIPKNKISDIEDKLQNGDIIGITTSVAGLDIAHEGFVLKKNGHAYLLHASSELKKVVVSDETIAEYLARHKTQTGIMVARPN